MKMKFRVCLSLLVVLNCGLLAHAQPQPVYKIPDAFRFDIDVLQTVTGSRVKTDTAMMHSLYTRSGEYAAVQLNAKGKMRGNLTILITRDGMGIFIDEYKKSITILSMRKMVSEFAGFAKWIRMDSVVAGMRRKMSGSQMKSVKTGNRKTIDGYASEEYSLTDSSGAKGSVWLAKADFQTGPDYILNAVGGSWIQMMTSQMNNNLLLQAILQPKTLVTDISLTDSSGRKHTEWHTIHINPTPTILSTAGFAVNDYSNMSLPDIFRAEMMKRNEDEPRTKQ